MPEAKRCPRCDRELDPKHPDRPVCGGRTDCPLADASDLATKVDPGTGLSVGGVVSLAVIRNAETLN
ncbi:hypothetical protein HY933_01420 [Candidatus Falkowbacteria bacterium]|nr:hypothetical protein [Candidatus Falkowbacteria bacterium]